MPHCHCGRDQGNILAGFTRSGVLFNNIMFIQGPFGKYSKKVFSTHCALHLNSLPIYENIKIYMMGGLYARVYFKIMRLNYEAFFIIPKEINFY